MRGYLAGPPHFLEIRSAELVETLDLRRASLDAGRCGQFGVRFAEGRHFYRRTSAPEQSGKSAKANGIGKTTNVRFSNRPFEVKHFQTIHQCGVDVARGLVLLFGIGTGAFPSWDSRTRRNNLLVGLAVEERRVQADIRTHLIHRPARDIFPPLGGTLVFSYRV